MAATEAPQDQKVTVKEMSWDPVTRIVGSLGIHTEIDFTNQQVLKCYSTSMLFRGFDIFMKGIDPRDAHFITSRICGICGDNHCTCSCLNQNMAYSVKPPKLGDFAFNLAESADFMFDHAIYNDCMANVDYSEQMVKETNPSVLAKAENTPAPHSDIHGHKTIADIMRALNAFTGSFYLETLQVARYTREMYCLFGGRHTHPSTILPGGCSANITQQTCTEYYVRLMRYIDYCKRSVPMHDDLYDFFYEALPGYERVGFRETDIICWGCFDDPDYVDYDYKNMTEWGRHRYVTPGLVFKGELITTDLVEINLAIRILLGSSYFDDWSDEETFVTQDPLGNPIDKRHPWNKVTLPKPQARDFADKYSWVASPRMFDKRDGSFVANDTGGGPFARQWVTAKAGLVDIGYLKATGESLQMVLPKTGFMPQMELEWKIPPWSNAIEPAATTRPTRRWSRCTTSSARRPRSAPGGPRAGATSRSPRRPSPWASTRPPAACCRTTWSSARARSPTTSPTRPRRGAATRATPTGRQAPTRTRCRTRRSSRRTGPTTSRASTSCGRSTRSTRACPAACTCTARARSARWCTPRPGWPR
jgi:hydrogenase large subunit